MSPERLKEVEEIYHAVLEVPNGKRRMFLLDRCGDDDELRKEVESLLSYDTDFNSLIDNSPKSLVAELFSTEANRTVGKQINQYRILSLLGEGGMGSVFLAHDTKLERKVAIKFLNDRLSKDTNRLNRFFQEAKSASALNHPNIITVYEIGEVDDQPFITTEFIDGTTLNKYLSKETLKISEVLNIASQIGSALSSAHEAGIIHRDIKPENVMIRRDGIVKVLDFGLAKLTQEAIEIDSEAVTRAKNLTADGMILGTPQYMSPEQARGQKVDPRTDIFSFGAMLYEMISGRLPFSGINAIDTIGSILKDDPKSLREFVPDISLELEDIVEKALRKDRDHRYQSINDLLADLNNAKRTIELDTNAGNTVSVKPQETRFTTSIATVRRFSLIHLLLFSTAAIVLFGAIFWFFSRGSDQSLESLKTEEVANWTSSAGELYTVGSFSPDGKMVAFASTKTGTKNIWVKQSTSGEAIQITKDDFKNENPIWSPNGEEIAFFSAHGGDAGFWRVPTLGGSPKLIASANGGSRLRLWSKNNLIYFDSGGELYSIDIATGDKKQLTDLKLKGINTSSMNLSSDEKTIAYSTAEGTTFTISISDLNGSAPKKIVESPNEIKNISWHPDNRRLFYSASIDGIFQIFLTDIYGAPPRQVSKSEQDALVLNVSADGTRILYGSSKEESDVWGFNLKENKEFIAASDIDSELWADLSPDGKTLAYQSIKNLSQGNKLFSGKILTKTIGSNEQPTELVASGGLPKWSPDGKTLAFIKTDSINRQIQIVNPAIGVRKQLTTIGVYPVTTTILPYDRLQTNDFAWSPDSGKIAFLSLLSAEKPQNIWVANADGSSELNLTENLEPNLSLNCPLWSSDGKHLAYSAKSNNIDGKATYAFQVINTETKKNDRIFEQNSFIRLLGWSANGNELIFAGVPNLSAFALPTEVSLGSVEIATGKTKKIAILKDVYLYNIHLSADKKSIAFVSHYDDKDNISLISVSGGEARKLTDNNDSRLYFSSLAWSPDSTSIFFGKQLRYSLLSMLTNFK